MSAKVKWPIKKLGDLAEFRNGVNYNKSSFGEGIKVVGVSDFQDYTKPRYAELEQINPKGIVTERNILHDGDIVFVRSNGNRELIGRSLFIEQPPEEVTHSAFSIRLRFTSREVYPKFYAYCFRTPLIRQGLTACGGSSAKPILRQDAVLFIDARHIYRQIDRAHREWTPAQISFLANVVRLYRGEELDFTVGNGETEEKIKEVFGRKPKYADVAGLCKAATLKEIETQGWSLNPGRYVGVAPGEEVSDEDFKEQFEALTEELETLNGQARELEATIAKNAAEILAT
jgi:hypothetical protein